MSSATLFRTKNFVVSFGSKEIDVGDFFHIDFSKTTGEYSYFSVKVTNPNGTTQDYQVTDISSNFTIGFNKAGSYPIDVQVVWKDGTDRGLDDFYGPTVTVGSKDDSSTGDSNQSVDITEDSDELSSLSLLSSSFIALQQSTQKQHISHIVNIVSKLPQQQVSLI